MTKGLLQHVTTTYRAHLLAHEKAATHALQQAHAHTLSVIQPKLAHLYRQIADKQQAGEDVPLHWLYEQHRLQAIKQLISNQVDHFGAMAQVTTNHLQRAGVQLGGQAAQAQLKASVPAGIHYAFGVPHPGAIANMVGATQQGSPLADLFAGFGEEAADKAGKALITGITLGNNPREVARDVQQALDISRQRAQVIAQNEMVRAYRSANSEIFQQNADVLDGWIWQASMGTACAMCSAMNGEEFPVGEEMESHVGCRCVQVPKTKPWSEILGNAGIDTSDLDIDETSIDVESGTEWFDDQPAGTQKNILGPAKFAAYQDGAITLKDLVGVSHSSEWGTSRYEKSLKEILGAKKAQHYYAAARR